MEKPIKSLVFEGQTLALKEVLFRCPERGLTVVYTQNREYNIWLFDLTVENSTFFFDNQKSALTALAEQPHVIDLYGEAKINEETIALVTEAVEKDSLASKIAETQIIDHDILTIGINACHVLCTLQEEEKTGNFIHPDYIYPDKAGNFKFLNFTLAFNRQLLKDKHKPILDSKMFSENRNFKLLVYADYLTLGDEVLSLGLLLYQLSFGDLNIERDPQNPSKLVFPDNPKRSFCIQSVVEECLMLQRAKRANPGRILSSFINEQRLDLPDLTGSVDSTIMANISLQNLEKTPNSENVKPKFMASVTWLLSKATTDTEGWFRSYVLENSSVPEEEFVNKIVEKAWRKKDKVKKLFDIIDKFMDDEETMKNSVIISKLLLFFHSLMNKGPVDFMTEQISESSKKTPRNLKIVVGSCSYLNYLLRKIRLEWEIIAKSGLKYKGDKLRSQGLSYLIFFYSIVLCEKSKFGLDYYKVFGGNFCIDPLLKSQEVREMFSQKTFSDLHGYCSMLLRFFRLLPEDIGMKTIQFAVAKAVTFEIQYLLGVFCYAVLVFKTVACRFEQVDRQAIKKIISNIETSLDNCIIRYHYCLEDLKASSAFKIYADLLPQSSLTAMNEVKRAQLKTEPLELFPIEEYFPINVPLGSFEIQASYSTDESPNRIIGEEEKLAIIKRELIKSTKVSVSQATSSHSPPNLVLNVSSKSSTVRRENIKPSLTHSEKLIHEKGSGEDGFDNEGNNTESQSPQKVLSVCKKLPAKVPLMSISRKGAEINPFLNASETEQHDRLDQIIEEAKASSERRDEDRLPRSREECRDEQYSNEGEGDEHKDYNKFDDSVEIDKNDIEIGVGLQRKSENKAFDASKAMKNEFFKLVPFPVAKEDKQIQCDLDNECPPSSNRGFNLEKFMREEISNDIQDWIIKYKDLKFGKEIANGSTCTVLQAIKKLKIDVDMKFMKEFKRELAVMLRIRPHPNLVSFIGVCNEDGHLILVTEYCQGGTLFSLLHKNKSISLSVKQKKKIMTDVARGMIFLHENNTPVIHRDLKSLNLLFDCPIQSSETMNFNVKIADFGLSKFIDTQNYQMTSFMGTFHWMAPEIINNEKYTLKVDVYSFAVVMWEILARLTPFAELKNPNAIIKYVAVDKGRPRMADLPSTTNRELIDLMVRCWDDSPDKRPTFSQILSLLGSIEV